MFLISLGAVVDVGVVGVLGCHGEEKELYLFLFKKKNYFGCGQGG